MTTNQALAMLLLARERGEVRLLRFELSDGTDVGPEAMVAAAYLSGYLPECFNVDDILVAARFGLGKYLKGEIKHRRLITAIKEVVRNAKSILDKGEK